MLFYVWQFWWFYGTLTDFSSPLYCFKRSVGSMFYTACINECNTVLCYCCLFSCVMGISPWWIFFIHCIACMPVIVTIV